MLAILVYVLGEPEQQLNETIFYNEHFGWEWDQGRLGFGPNGIFASLFINNHAKHYH